MNATIISPTLTQMRAYDGDARFCVLQTSLHADVDTPITAFAKLAAGKEQAFLLESAESGGRFGRWSFMGAEVIERLQLRDGVATWQRGDRESNEPFTDPLLPIRARLAEWTTWAQGDVPPFSGGPLATSVLTASGISSQCRCRRATASACPTRR